MKKIITLAVFMMMGMATVYAQGPQRSYSSQYQGTRQSSRQTFAPGQSVPGQGSFQRHGTYPNSGSRPKAPTSIYAPSIQRGQQPLPAPRPVVTPAPRLIPVPVPVPRPIQPVPVYHPVKVPVHHPVPVPVSVPVPAPVVHQTNFFDLLIHLFD